MRSRVQKRRYDIHRKDGSDRDRIPNSGQRVVLDQLSVLGVDLHELRTLPRGIKGKNKKGFAKIQGDPSKRSCTTTGPVDRMSHRKWRETKQQLI